MSNPPPPRDRTRGAVSNGEGRFAKTISIREDDGWSQPAAVPACRGHAGALRVAEARAAAPYAPAQLAPAQNAEAGFVDDSDGVFPASDAPPPRPTELLVDRSKRIISRNDSPDIPFAQSINPYKGCEHGCIYCFARPTHSYLDLSPGLDFETKIAWKPEAVTLLRAELAKPGYQVTPIAFGTNTDPWQPLERAQNSTRELLELLYECRHPITVVTKGSLILRDVDLLAKFARENLVRVMLSITTLDNALKAKMEPRAAAPVTRLRAVRELRAAGVPVGVLFAPAIPFVNDHEMEAVLEASREAGAETAAFLLLRLPHEVKDLFAEWLQTHFPDRAARVMAIIHDARGGHDNDPRFFHRHRGEGVFADLLARRFTVAVKKLGYLPRSERMPLDVSLFRPPAPVPSWLLGKRRPAAAPSQGDLFGF